MLKRDCIFKTPFSDTNTVLLYNQQLFVTLALLNKKLLGSEQQICFQLFSKFLEKR